MSGAGRRASLGLLVCPIEIRTCCFRLIVLVACLAIVGCGKSDIESGTPVTSTRDVVATSFYPTTFMAEQLLGSAVPVECIVPEGVEPSAWRPNDNAVQQLQSAKLVVLNGAGFEKWVTTTTLPAARLVDTTSGLAEPLIQYRNVITHQHGPAGDQSREGIDAHTWLDPIIAKHQATKIAEAATREWPEHAAAIETNLRSLCEKFDEIDQRFKALTPQFAKLHFLCSQPAYNYLGRRYEWEIQNIDSPLPAGLPDDLPDDLKVGSTPIFIWESEPDSKTVAELATAGIYSVTFRTGKQRPESGDYLTLMNANLDAPAKAIGELAGDKKK